MRIKSLIFILFILLNFPSSSQNTERDYYFMFYNVENLFDVEDDPETEDEEFTAEGLRHWTYRRFNKKLLNISKVILSAAGWQLPHLVALCEVENRYVLEKLLKDTPLKHYQYKIIHKESPDSRGIDVALLYNADEFYPLEYRYYPLTGKTGAVFNTREILYVSGILDKTDTIHVFANHWPSRYSGLMESQDTRNFAAGLLHACVDSVLEGYLNPKIIIAGDFNDQPSDESISHCLNALIPDGDYEKNRLYNLSWPWLKKDIQTLKHQMQWSVFDQIIVSGSLMAPGDGLYTKPEWTHIADLPFLLEKDIRYGGLKLNRTYIGYRYHGGFSDHLPVVLKLRKDL